MNIFSHSSIDKSWRDHENNEIEIPITTDEDVYELLLPIDTPFEEQLLVEVLCTSGFTWEQSCRLLDLKKRVSAREEK